MYPEFDTNLHNQKMPVTIRLHIEGIEVEVVIEEIHRVLPNKRLVARGSVNDQEYLFKLFYGPAAKKHCAREATGALNLKKTQVSTPELLLQGEAIRPPGHFLAFEYIKGAQPLEEPVDKEEFEEVIRVLALMHEAGYYQSDMHLRNFIRGNDGVLQCIDGDSVRGGSTLARQTCLANLTMLFVQLGPDHDHMFADGYKVYVAARNWQASTREKHAFFDELTRARRDRIRRFAEKTVRDCTEFRVVKSFMGFQASQRLFHSEIEPFLRNPIGLVNAGVVLKQGNSATVVKVIINGEDYVIKRYRHKSWLRFFRRGFKVSRARNSWTFGLSLKHMNIPTAEPMAFIEVGFGPFVRDAFLLTRALEGPDLKDIAEKTGEIPVALEDAVVSIFSKLGRVGFVHKDLKATNLLQHEGGVSLIDLDAMSFDLGEGHRRDVDRFLRNWDHLPKQRAHFEKRLSD